MEEPVRIVLKIIHVSDTHIKKHKNLLAPMVDFINNEDVDLVVITGDLVHEPTEELYQIAEETLNNVTHQVVVVPGEYDYGPLWEKYFGSRYKSKTVSDRIELDFMDTSFMGNRFSTGWLDFIEKEDKEQADWIKSRLADKEKYHIVFSHHPVIVALNREYSREYFSDALRAAYSGHIHEPFKTYFKYVEPKVEEFDSGLVTVPVKFHGNAVYNLILLDDKDKIVNVPRSVYTKVTAW